MLHIVYLRPAGLFLTKKQYQSWRDIQDEYEQYMTSLGPWDVESVIDFIRSEYPKNPPFSERQIRQFIGSEDLILNAAV